MLVHHDDNGLHTQADAKQTAGAVLNVNLDHFASAIGTIRAELKIPGLSAGIVRNGQLIWAEGFGLSNAEEAIAATSATPYGLASVTKPFAAFLLMRKVEDGLLDLDTPVCEFGVHIGEGITVRHLLSHTSEGTPGDAYSYSGSRYSHLTRIIEQLYGDSFRRVLRQQLFVPLAMNDTVLNHGSASLDDYLSTLEANDPELDFVHVYRDAAIPYQYNSHYDVYPVSVPSYVNAGAGLISTVEDLAQFAVAITKDALVAAETKRQMFSPTRLNSGATGLYGLGWFAETVDGIDLIWHYGYGCYSTLFLMVPSEGLTFIALANTQNLSRPFGLGKADVSVLASPVALEFYKQLIVQPQLAEPLPIITWDADEDAVVEQLSQIEDPTLRALYEGELWTYLKLIAGAGRKNIGPHMLSVHRAAFPDFERSAMDQIVLTDDELFRWLGRFTLKADDAASEFPPELSIESSGNEMIIIVAADVPPHAFYAETATRLRAYDDAARALVASEEDSAFSDIDVEYGGKRAATYERTN
jgi:CubicO group peptidase (beta-lactamase class C family)